MLIERTLQLVAVGLNITAAEVLWWMWLTRRFVPWLARVSGRQPMSVEERALWEDAGASFENPLRPREPHPGSEPGHRRYEGRVRTSG